ncbi:26S proteasome non-ATPase regulatory protein [Phytophthora megakarya]|uniref:26S proteasome non-ATPase regulatory protein n=1 Tax=Phytophthora megakarya TaxID=4795 RepID=A0A225WAL6_9STRA|nr:26S proteasome non-ATPase regulatory protein [Phytophthora megakarya]
MSNCPPRAAYARAVDPSRISTASTFTSLLMRKRTILQFPFRDAYNRGVQLCWSAALTSAQPSTKNSTTSILHLPAAHISIVLPNSSETLISLFPPSRFLITLK